jgi:bacteriorhodopsin
MLTAGMPWPTILYTILIDEVMVVTGLVGVLVKSTYKWGYFVFDCVAFFFVAWTIVFDARGQARNLGADINRVYTICGVWIVGLWCLYPIAWGVSEGGNVISPDSEAIFYGVLDLLAKPVFAALFLWGHRNIDVTRLGLNLRIPGPDGASGPSGAEKATNGTPATNDATATTA